jgi:hypothetical protein
MNMRLRVSLIQDNYSLLLYNYLKFDCFLEIVYLKKTVTKAIEFVENEQININKKCWLLDYLKEVPREPEVDDEDTIKRKLQEQIKLNKPKLNLEALVELRKAQRATTAPTKSKACVIS